MMKKFFFVLIIFSALTGTILSQEVDETPPNVLLYKERSVGFILHTNGYGFNFRRGKHLTALSKRLIEFEFITEKHPKELKIQSNYDNSKGYFYGKKNEFFILKSAFGLQRTIYRKEGHKSIEIRTILTVGPTLGILKPIYYLVDTPVSGSSSQNRTQTKLFDTSNVNFIKGRASFFKGFDKIGIMPGASAKFGFSFDYGGRNDNVKILETGIMVDAFMKKVPIMASNDNKQVFFNLYILLSFGKKW